MECNDSSDDWVEAGQRAVMLMTSSMHHAHVDGDWIAEARDLMTGMNPCEMALTLMWAVRLGAESSIQAHDNDPLQALATLRDIGLGLERALSSDLAGEEVRD